MTQESALAVQGGVAATFVFFLQQAVLRMIPYSIPALALVTLDLFYGVSAAKCRGERVRFSTAMRRTATKVFGYVVWLILASTLALAFGKEWLEWGVLAFVYINEFVSILGNYFERKGVAISLGEFWKLVIRKVAGKAGVEVSKDEIDDVIKKD